MAGTELVGGAEDTGGMGVAERSEAAPIPPEFVATLTNSVAAATSAAVVPSRLLAISVLTAM